MKTKILKWFKPDQIGRVSVGAVTLKDETLQQYDIKTGDTINVFLTYPSCKCDHEICTFVDVYKQDGQLMQQIVLIFIIEFIHLFIHAAI